ncbi:response regulator [Chitinivibrio alkaliphilus]|uniref:Response regulator receiver protein n=1 Tax=Chitinivibrio alkaliphilus ACht1 TaxID=1313304 RepID=U7D3J5_9BACT|nr:response regulator [Chitinivibrio alkaliphilus]ERP31074.1 response regulator receiver protein [Chitinivibrio alkaliphilus ACht1]
MTETEREKKEVVLLIADDDDGHAELIIQNLRRAGVTNTIHRFYNGQEVIDFFFRSNNAIKRQEHTPYVLLLDIRMPRMDGMEVLRQIKQDPELKKLPVIMVTTTDDPFEIEECHALGCNSYITKPVEYSAFVTAIQQLGLFISIVQIPELQLPKKTQEQQNQ